MRTPVSPPATRIGWFRVRGSDWGCLLLGVLLAAGCSPRRPAAPPEEISSKAPSAAEKWMAVTEEPAATEVEAPEQEAAAEPVSEAPSATAPQETAPQEPPPQAAAPSTPPDGKALYARHCAACHGDAGNGQGVAADWLFPKPRNFGGGKFRLVSTSNGVPSREDLHAVLTRGMPGSAMPPWPHLSQAERDALVDEVQRLTREGMRATYLATLKEQEGLTDEELEDPDIQAEVDEFLARRTAPGEATEVPPIAPADDAAIARGKELYASQGCAACHGLTGKGDGQQQMVDDEGLPTRPRDLTKGIYKGGHDPASVYRRIAYGMPGTPMPSSVKMTPEQMVDVVHFLLSLSDKATRQAAILNREKIVAKKVDRAPDMANDLAWRETAPVSLRMTPLWWRDDADPDLSVQAVHDGQTIALKLSWRDTVHDQHEARSESFEDAIAAELFVGDAEPFIGMGGPQTPVDVWFWDADQQAPRLTVEDLYPHTVVDVYPFGETVVESPGYDRPGAQDKNQPDISLPARAVGNPIAAAAHPSAGTSLTAGGPSTVTFRLPRSQLVAAHGQWSDGRWTVVLRRSLAVADPADGVALTPGGKASIAFAVWDGDQRDRDGKKLVTIWQELELEAK